MLNGFCGNCRQTSLCIIIVYTTRVIISYKLQKFDNIHWFHWGQTIQNLLSLGEFYDLNIIVMKKNCTWGNLKYSGHAMLQNWIKCLLLICADSKLRCSETYVRYTNHILEGFFLRIMILVFVCQVFFEL